jgi:hypothetical protein
LKLREEVKFESNKFKISLLDDHIVRVEIFRHAEVNIDDLDRNYKIYESFLIGRRLPFLIVFGEFSIAQRDVQKKFADQNRSAIKSMEAYVVNSLPHRIMGNFHIKFFKPKHPTKIFGTEKDALKWIQEKNLELEQVESKSTSSL